jgi:hypothetical protein
MQFLKQELTSGAGQKLADQEGTRSADGTAR